jgi:hypothetical protein
VSDPDFSLIATEDLPIDEEDTGLAVELNEVGASRTCATQSAMLPSYLTGDEADAFSAVVGANVSVFMDIVRDDDSNFRWSEREFILVRCDGDTGCSGTDVANPCIASTTSDACLAIQYNNLAFLATGSNINDGKTETSQTIAASGFIDIPIVTTQSQVKVRYYGPVSPVPLITIQSPVVVSCTLASGEYTCDTGTGAAVATVRVSATASMAVREVLVYNVDDTTRFLNFYS